MQIIRIGSIAALALLVLSCASANRLAKRSERELARGDLPHAYEHARAAVKRQPSNPRARAAFTAAASGWVADRKARILAIADADTIAAARQLLALTELRGEIADYEVALPPDTAFSRRESALRIGAAHILYTRAEGELAVRQPRRAWEDFTAAAGFASGYRDTRRRIEEAYALALARVAILPPADQAGVPGLSRALADRIYAEVAPHAGPEGFRFTRLVDPGAVYGTLTVAELDALTPGDAMRIGRRLGADQVVTGRVYGMRSSTDTHTYQQTIFRKIVDRDSAGTRRARYLDQAFTVVVRERQVAVRYDLEVMAVADGAARAAYSDVAKAYARVIFTDHQVEGDCDDYCLVPPDLKRSDAARAARLEAEWKGRYGSWSVPLLLEQARKDRAHRRYGSDDRSEFFGDCRERPVWLGELPSENDLAGIALDTVWQPVLGMLQQLDAE